MTHYFRHRKILYLLISLSICAAIYAQPLGELKVFEWPAQVDFRALMLSLSASGASLLGFVLAANTFLISHTQHRRLTLLRRSAGYKQLLEIMRSSLWRLFALMIYAGVGSLTSAAFIHLVLIGAGFLITFTAVGLATLIWSTMATLSIPLD